MIVEPNADHLVWLDGEIVPWRKATMHVSDHHYGIGVFEGVRSYAIGQDGASLFRLRDHTQRFLRSAHILGMRLPAPCDQRLLNEVQVELVRRNRLRDAYLRPFAFYGGAFGLAPRTQSLTVHVAVLALEWKGTGEMRPKNGGLKLHTSTFSRYHANSLLTRAKANANYMNGILAVQEAHRNGADDVLLLDAQGYVCETSGANVFVVRDGVLFTPPLECVLEGITRDTVFQLASGLGLTVVERRITRDDVYVADEAFVTGTAAEIMPIREVDGRAIGGGSGKIGPVMAALYADHVRGRAEHRPEWLTSVY